MRDYDFSQNYDFKEWNYVKADGTIGSNIGLEEEIEASKERKAKVLNLVVNFGKLISNVFNTTKLKHSFSFDENFEHEYKMCHPLNDMEAYEEMSNMRYR